MGTNGFDLAAALSEVEKATEHLVDTAEGLADADVAAPSLLAGWTRGHLLTHVARNADGLINLLTWARTGVETPAYASDAARDADIEAGAGRSAAELLGDVRTSAGRFAEACRTQPDDAWSAEVRRSGREFPASRILWFRLREVLIHHVDLDAGYSPAHWPAGFVSRCLDEVAHHFEERDDFTPLALRAEDTGRRFRIRLAKDTDSPLVSGPEPALLAWLIGRSAGDGLDVEPDGPLPAVPSWA